MYYTSGCNKKDCKSITLLYDMKYKMGDIVTTKQNKQFLILDCFINNDNQKKFYEVKEIWSKWKSVRCINLNHINNHTELDIIYLRNEKLTKIKNRINESISSL